MDLKDFIKQPEEADIEEIKESKLKTNPFLVVNDIRNGKGLTPIEVSYHMNPYITNKALTQHIDTLFFAQEMNRRWQLDKNIQYEYLFHSIKKYKRDWVTWSKAEQNDDIELLMEYYGYSFEKAKQVLPLHSKEILKKIKNRFGGINEQRKKNS